MPSVDLCLDGPAGWLALADAECPPSVPITTVGTFDTTRSPRAHLVDRRPKCVTYEIPEGWMWPGSIVGCRWHLEGNSVTLVYLCVTDPDETSILSEDR